jgi:hypothetical protein
VKGANDRHTLGCNLHSSLVRSRHDDSTEMV